MDLATLEWLLTPPGQRLLAEADEARREGLDPLRAGERLRARADPERAAAASALVALRARATTKLGPDAAVMVLLPEALEQATHHRVAAHRAERLVAAGGAGVPLTDLGCGLGADLVACARAGASVTGVERDPVRAAAAQANLAALGLPGRVVVGDATAVDLDRAGTLVLDPARRTARGRTFDVEGYQPPWSFVTRVLTRPACVKVAPGVPHDRVPPDVEAEWVSLGGEVKEAALWSPALAGARRRATVLPTEAGGRPATVSEADAPRAQDLPQAARLGRPGRYLVEPDGAVVRAGLVTAVAAEVDGWLLDAHLAYVTTDRRPTTRLGRAYEVLEQLPYAEKRLRAALRERGVGSLTIKKRGVATTPEELRARLRLRGDRSATLVLSRSPHGALALLVDPLG